MAQSQQVYPGTQCEIDCIRVDKIYDQCYLLEELPDTVEIDVPRTLRDTDSISCEITDVDCEVLEPLRDPDPEGYRTIDVVQNVTFNLSIINQNGNEFASITVQQPPNYKSVTLYAPEGTYPECEIVDTFCEPVLIVDPGSDTTPAIIRVLKKLCKIVSVVARVNLLVPTFGFCQPEPCEVFPQEFACPPENLFPPQKPILE